MVEESNIQLTSTKVCSNATSIILSYRIRKNIGNLFSGFRIGSGGQTSCHFKKSYQPACNSWKISNINAMMENWFDSYLNVRWLNKANSNTSYKWPSLNKLHSNQNLQRKNLWIKLLKSLTEGQV